MGAGGGSLPGNDKVHAAGAFDVDFTNDVAARSSATLGSSGLYCPRWKTSLCDTVNAAGQNAHFLTGRGIVTAPNTRDSRPGEQGGHS